MMVPLMTMLLFLVAITPGVQSDPTELQSTEARVTILFDNFTDRDDLTTGWGFAALVETPEHTLLFDTGADGEILLENMRLLGKDPLAIETVLISHAHSDHTGGLQALLALGLEPTIYLLSSFPDPVREAIPSSARVLDAMPGQEILPGVFTTGQVGTTIPEQALVLKTDEGIVVVTGCAHPGAVDMVERAHELIPGPLQAVMGGFHLMQAQESEIAGIIGQLRDLGVKEAGPTHCSGELAMNLFHEAYGGDFVLLGVGRVLTFHLSDSEEP